MKPFDCWKINLNQTSLIEASAGTGKTYAITGLVARLLLEKEIELKQILIVTFTIAATQELSERIRQRLQKILLDLKAGSLQDSESELFANLQAQPHLLERAPQRLDTALRNFEEASIHTIHGFCAKALAENALESGQPFVNETLSSDGEILQDLILDEWVQRMMNREPMLIQALSEFSFSLDKVRRFGGEWVRYPQAQLLPPGPKKAPITPDFPAAKKVLERAWHQDKAALQRHLTNPNLFNQSSYKAASVQDWLRDWERFFQKGEFRSPKLPPKAEKFTLAQLEKGTKGKQLLPPDFPTEFATEVGRFVELWNGIRELALWEYHDLAQSLSQRFESTKRQKGLMSMQDMILRLREALQQDASGQFCHRMQNLYRAALIDEFQDTDADQLYIFNTLFDHPPTPFLMIGDPKQSIYRFRGADIHTYLKTAHKAQERTFGMEINWRSNARLIQGLNRFYAVAPQPFWNEQIQYQPVSACEQNRQESDQAGLEIHFLSGEDKETKTSKKPILAPFSAPESRAFARQFAVEQTLRLITQEKLAPEEIAILTFKNEEALLIQEMLLSQGIPAVTKSAEKVFQSPEAWEIWQFLQAVLNPKRLHLIRAALSLPWFGFSLSQLAQLRHDWQAMGDWSLLFVHMQEAWEKQGLAALKTLLMEKVALMPNLLSDHRGERKWTNLNHLFELMLQEEAQHLLSPESLVVWLGRKINQEEAGDEVDETRLETDAKAVQIMTIFKSKGLEFKAVILPYAGMGKKASSRSDFLRLQEADQIRFWLMLGDKKTLPEESAHFLEQEALAESLRLLYVSLTRAKLKVLVALGAFSDFHLSALNFHLAKTLGSTAVSTDIAGIQEEIKQLDHQAYWEALQAFTRQNSPSITLQAWSTEKELPRLKGKPSPATPLSARQLAKDRRFTSFTITSYSGLIKGAEPFFHPSEEEIPTPAAPEPLLLGGSSILLERFPKGAEAGNFFHYVLEEITFADPQELTQTIAMGLQRFGLEQDPHLEKAFFAILAAPLEPGLSLNQLAASDCLKEMEFMIRVGSQGPHFSPSRLAQVLRQHPGPWSASYPEAIEKLEFRAIVGFLKGFVDLVFRHQGKYYILDYKSNYLGNRYEDYQAPSLVEAMDQHHYHLQYLIYCVALRRHLQLWPDFNWDRDFGGVFYLFLRGLRPEGNEGIFADCPNSKLLDALEGVFDHG